MSAASPHRDRYDQTKVSFSWVSADASFGGAGDSYIRVEDVSMARSFGHGTAEHLTAHVGATSWCKCATGRQRDPVSRCARFKCRNDEVGSFFPKRRGPGRYSNSALLFCDDRSVSIAQPNCADQEFDLQRTGELKSEGCTRRIRINRCCPFCNVWAPAGHVGFRSELASETGSSKCLEKLTWLARGYACLRSSLFALRSSLKFHSEYGRVSLNPVCSNSGRATSNRSQTWRALEPPCRQPGRFIAACTIGSIRSSPTVATCSSTMPKNSVHFGSGSTSTLSGYRPNR
jgi:hypothetical protein